MEYAPTPAPTTQSDVYQAQGWKDVVVTLYISLCVGAVLLSLFELLRGRKLSFSRNIYRQRHSLRYRKLSTRLRNIVMPPYPRGLFNWVADGYHRTDVEFLDSVGLDAYVCLRYLRFCRNCCFVGALLGMIILTPMYITENHTNSVEMMTMASLRDSSSELWACVAVAYLFSAYVMYALRTEYTVLNELRNDWLGEGDVSVTRQTSYTIMVERIPHVFRSRAMLEIFFNTLFPGQVHSAIVCLDLADVRQLVNKRIMWKNKWEQAVLLEKAQKVKEEKSGKEDKETEEERREYIDAEEGKRGGGGGGGGGEGERQRKQQSSDGRDDAPFADDDDGGDGVYDDGISGGDGDNQAKQSLCCKRRRTPTEEKEYCAQKLKEVNDQLRPLQRAKLDAAKSIDKHKQKQLKLLGKSLGNLVHYFSEQIRESTAQEELTTRVLRPSVGGLAIPHATHPSRGRPSVTRTGPGPGASTAGGAGQVQIGSLSSTSGEQQHNGSRTEWTSSKLVEGEDGQPFSVAPAAGDEGHAPADGLAQAHVRVRLRGGLGANSAISGSPRTSGGSGGYGRGSGGGGSNGGGGGGRGEGSSSMGSAQQHSINSSGRPPPSQSRRRTSSGAGDAGAGDSTGSRRSGGGGGGGGGGGDSTSSSGSGVGGWAAVRANRAVSTMASVVDAASRRRSSLHDVMGNITHNHNHNHNYFSNSSPKELQRQQVEEMDEAMRLLDEEEDDYLAATLDSEQAKNDRLHMKHGDSRAMYHGTAGGAAAVGAVSPSSLSMLSRRSSDGIGSGGVAGGGGAAAGVGVEEMEEGRTNDGDKGGEGKGSGAATGGDDDDGGAAAADGDGTSDRGRRKVTGINVAVERHDSKVGTGTAAAPTVIITTSVTSKTGGGGGDGGDRGGGDPPKETLQSSTGSIPMDAVVEGERSEAEEDHQHSSLLNPDHDKNRQPRWWGGRPSSSSRHIHVNSHSASRRGVRVQNVAHGVVGAVGLGALEVAGAVKLLTSRSMSGTGFVTFKTMTARACAIQARLCNVPKVFEVMSAPEARDMKWENITHNLHSIHVRRSLVNAVLAVGILFWSTIVTAIQALSDPATLEKILPFFAKIEENNPTLARFITAYLPVLLLLLLTSNLYFILKALAGMYEGYKSHSEVELAILTRTFYFQLANVYVTVTSGSIAKDLQAFIASPSSVLTILGAQIPNVGIYFTNLIIVKVVGGLMMELCFGGRVLKFWRMAVVELLANPKLRTKKDRVTGLYMPSEPWYGLFYANFLLVIIICFTYQVIAPFVIAFGTIYFLVAEYVYKYNLTHCFWSMYESGGVFWYKLGRQTVIGCVGGQIVLIAFMSLKAGVRQVPVLLVLPIICGWYGHQLDKEAVHGSDQLSLDKAMVEDKEEENIVAEGGQNVWEFFEQSAYAQPSLNMDGDEEDSTTAAAAAGGAAGGGGGREAAAATAAADGGRVRGEVDGVDDTGDDGEDSDIDFDGYLPAEAWSGRG